jgi:hypothetical protein
MSDDNVQFVNQTQQVVNQTQQASRLALETITGVAETQFTIAQRLGGIQQSFFNQAIEAANDQLQLISRVKEPREYASAQAELVKSHGQRYIDTVKEAINIVADAWQEYGDRLDEGVHAVANRTQRTSSYRRAA